MEEPNSDMDHIQPDPLLKPGAFIDPNPTSNGFSNLEPFSTVDPSAVDPPQPSDQKVGVTSNGNPTPDSSTVDPSMGASQPSDQKGETPASAPRPDWLPPGWSFVERVRASGASAGSRDKYYVDPVTQRRFRSKKEVLYYLETGSTKKRKNADSDAEGSPATDSTAKGKKSEAKAKISLNNFNFDDVPAKVKWELSDIYEGTWRPLMNGVDRVPESAKQEWSAAFTYLTLQNGGGCAGFF